MSLPSEQQENREARLIDLQRHLEREVVSVGAAARAASSARRDPGDEADAASDQVEQDAGAVILTVLVRNAEQVERALELLHGGLYGRCEDCGREIPAERIEVLPEATRCLACQVKHDQRSAPPSSA